MNEEEKNLLLARIVDYLNSSSCWATHRGHTLQIDGELYAGDLVKIAKIVNEFALDKLA